MVRFEGPQGNSMSSSSARFVAPVSNPLATPSFGRPPSSTPPTTSQLPIKRLTPAEIQAKRENGLCYSCDEKFNITHCCKNHMMLLLDDECINSSTATDGEAIQALGIEIVSEQEVSLHAFTNNSNL